MTREAVQALGMTTGGLNRKLTDAQVKSIRENDGTITDAEFAADFGVNDQTVFHARVGNTYKHHTSAPRRRYAARVSA